MKAVLRWLSCLAFIVLCAQAVAHTMEERISELEKEMQEVGTTNPADTYGAGFASAAPDTENDWFIFLEPLYWHAKAGGTEYAYTDETLTQPSDMVVPPIKGRVKGQSFGWEWGLRVGLGYHFNHDDWDVSADYTWYEADQTTSVHKNLPSAALPLKGGLVGPLQRAKSHYDLNYNNVNVELGRHYFMSSKVSVRPQIGLQSAWIFNRQNIQYNVGLHNFLLAPGHHAKVREKSVLWGMGPRAGAEGQWSLGDGFSICGKVAGALLYSYSRASINGKVSPSVTLFGDRASIRLSENRHLFIPTVQMFLGALWESYINQQRQHITLGAGYEVQYFWRANQQLQADDTIPNPFLFSNVRYQVSSVSEDVMFYGITIKVRLDF